jgi:hypothetical protein
MGLGSFNSFKNLSIRKITQKLRLPAADSAVTAKKSVKQERVLDAQLL